MLAVPFVNRLRISHWYNFYGPKIRTHQRELSIFVRTFVTQVAYHILLTTQINRMNHPTDFPLLPQGPLSKMALERGLTSFSQLTDYIRRLPYGRTSQKTQLDQVFSEQKGTCSSKHALLKAIAVEQQQALPSLVIGMYRMSQANTPGVGSVLQAHGLSYIPEAHCYLKYGEERVDVTSESANFDLIADALIWEEDIQAEQIGAYKLQLHQKFLRQWQTTDAPSHSFEELWAIREACIEALSQ